MPSLKSLKVRIKSIKSTEKITKAMKMVAASKLKKAREQAENAEPYADKMMQIVSSLASSKMDDSKGERNLLTVDEKLNKTHLLIVATSDKGLCGAFNSSIIKKTKVIVSEIEKSGKQVKVLFVGKKGYDLLKSNYKSHTVDHLEGIGRKGVKFTEASQISESVLELFEKEEIDSCSIVFNKFKSAISQITTHKHLIPLAAEEANDNETKQVGNNHGYEYEPSEEEILERILPKNLAVQIFHALLENNASEQGARMTAMDNATRNSGDMIKRLNLVYNRTRQAYITKELIEIISGAKALENNN